MRSIINMSAQMPDMNRRQGGTRLTCGERGLDRARLSERSPGPSRYKGRVPHRGLSKVSLDVSPVHLPILSNSYCHCSKCVNSACPFRNLCPFCQCESYRRRYHRCMQRSQCLSQLARNRADVLGDYLCVRLDRSTSEHSWSERQTNPQFESHRGYSAVDVVPDFRSEAIGHGFHRSSSGT